MLRRVRVLVVLVSLAGALTVGAAGASAANWVGLGDSYAAGPLIPNQPLNPLGCLRSDHNFAHLAAAALGRSLADVSCSGATTADMTAPQDVTPGPEPAAVQRADGRHADRHAADRRQRHRLHEHPRELRDRQPVRAPVPRPLRRQRARHARRPDRRHRAEGRRGAPGHPHALASARVLRRQLRGDPARDRQRLLAAGADRVRRRAVPAQRGEEPQRDARPAGGRQRRADRRRLHAPASAATRASRRQRAGSSRWCRPTPRRRSTPTPAARRGSPRWWCARCRASAAPADPTALSAARSSRRPTPPARRRPASRRT